jgi:hypothetical protein
MADNWAYVVAAYGLAALVLGAYWRRLSRRERAVTSEGAGPSAGASTTARAEPPPDPGGAGTAGARTEAGA